MTETTEMFRGFICGVISGWAQVFVMQPFQIIKVRLVNQSLTNPQYNGIVHCAQRIFKEQGIKSFYRGTLSPLIGFGLQGSLSFGFHQVFKKLLKKLDLKNQEESDTLMPLGQVFLSGVFTGMVTTITLTPADHVRIQLQKQIGIGKYKGTIDAAQDIYKRYGFKGLYTGVQPTFLRQVIALSIFFYTYQYTMRLFAPKGQGSLHAPLMASFLAGGLAGANSWLFTYPIDYIKTVMQSQDLQNIKFKSAWKCAKEKYETEGIKTFFKGLGITMLRSFPVNAVAFFSFEYLMRVTGWKKQ